MFFLSCILLSLSNGLAGSSEYCTESFDHAMCIFNMYCVNYIDTNSLQHYRVNNDGDLINEMGEANCENPMVINYRNYGCYPIHVAYKDLHILGSVPELSNEEVYMYTLIASLDLSNNNYGYMPTVRNLENLEKLTLSRNVLTTAKFSNENELPSLREIDLSHNTISILEIISDEYSYKGLKKIDLGYNYLVKVPEYIFDLFDKLETLDISHNFIDTLTYMTFEGLKNLLYLYLSHNRIADVNSSLFRFKELKLLDLSNNKIKILKERDFEKFNRLEKLDLSSNSISVIEKNVFQYMDLLSNLDLSNNDLEIVDKETFANLSSLKVIDLSKNNFKVLPKGLFRAKGIFSFSIKDNNLEGSLERGMFEGLRFVTELDLSDQRLAFIEDYAFYGLEKIEILLLNNNNIQLLSKMCFKILENLNRLDLSGNKLTNLEFVKDDLFNLRSLLLKNNFLTNVKHEHFDGLNALQLLDLSNNNISQLDSNSFKSLRELKYFEISNNPLMGTLEESTFDGLNSLPNLDISCTLLTTIQNSSFNGMIHLKHLNISHSRINELEYNSFLHTGAVETVDLSYNQITSFFVNSTELINLCALLLNNNLIKSLSLNAFYGMPRLLKITLARNNMKSIHNEAFKDQKDLRDLDLSYNSNFKFNVTLIRGIKKLNGLFLSGIKTDICFTQIGDTLLSEVEISHSGITDVKSLQLKELSSLDNLVLSNNDIQKLEAGALSNMKALRNLDVSYNKISLIQPGTFKDNIELYSLNISHNSLSVITYGIFRGLIHLNTLDVSYNNINDLQNERFHEVKSLSVLIADHNKIKTISSEEFSGMSLMELSIGENPLPCEILVNFKKRDLPFKVTAIRLDDTSDENVDGVTCNMNKYHPYIKSSYDENGLNEKILVNIRDILVNNSNKKFPDNLKATSVSDEKYLANITYQIEKSAVDYYNRTSHLANLTSTIVNENNITNILLERILKGLTINSIRKTTPLRVSKDNATFENLLSYINKIKQDLDTVAEKNDDIMNEVKNKISILNSRIDLLAITDKPKHEKLMAKVEPPKALESKSMFTETCVALILIILVGIVLYKFYKSRMYIRNRLSISTRELPGAMENSTL